MEGPDQALRSDCLEILQGRVDEDIEHLVHQGVAELDKRLFVRMGAGVVEG